MNSESSPIQKSHVKLTISDDRDALQHRQDHLRDYGRDLAALYQCLHLPSPDRLQLRSGLFHLIPALAQGILLIDDGIPCLDEYPVDDCLPDVLSPAAFRSIVAPGITLPVGLPFSPCMGLPAINAAAFAADDFRAEGPDFAAVTIARNMMLGHEPLDGARRVDARRTRPRRHQRPARTLAAAHGENHGARLVDLEPAAWRHRRDLRTAVRLRRDVQHHRAADNRDAERIRLVDKPLRVFGAGQLLLEAVEPEAVVDALLQNAARRVVTLEDKDVRRARLLRGTCGGESRRTRAHDKHIERVKSREL